MVEERQKDQTDADRFLGDNATNDVNAYLAKQIGHAQIHKGGLTYYYFPIRHLGNGGETNAGYYGVVRNHIYNCTITKIAGLGTAVYDPKEVIYPENRRMKRPSSPPRSASSAGALSTTMLNSTGNIYP